MGEQMKSDKPEEKRPPPGWSFKYILHSKNEFNKPEWLEIISGEE